MFIFGTLTEIVIIVTILVQCIFLFCVFTRSGSTDNVLVILIHRACHVSRISPHSYDYSAYSCGSSIGSIISPIPHYCGFCGLCLGFTCINIVRYVNLSHEAFYQILSIFLVLENKAFLPSFSFFRVYQNNVLFSSFYSSYLKYKHKLLQTLSRIL